jgi:hypothetical protein
VHGSKNGDTIAPAVLFDPPGLVNPRDGRHEYEFQTSAVDKATGRVYATIFWAFHFDKSAEEVVLGAVTVQSGSTPQYETSLGNHQKLLRTF